MKCFDSIDFSNDQFDVGKAVNVNISILVNDISSVSESEMVRANEGMLPEN